MRKTSKEGAEKKRLDRIATYGLCCKCKKKAISNGRGRLPSIARSKDMCLDCCREGRTDPVIGTLSTKKLGLPREEELQRFVDDLITRSPGVQSEVKRIERIKAAHKKRGERRKIGEGDIHYGPRRRQTKVHTDRVCEARRKKAIAEYGRCVTCRERAVSHGESPPSQRAGAAGQCLPCHYGDHRREKKWGDSGGESIALTLIEKNGLCPKCQEHPIASGMSRPAVLARTSDQCIVCYRASRPRREKGMNPRRPVCVECKNANVSRGTGETARYARKSNKCMRCYSGNSEGEGDR